MKTLKGIIMAMFLLATMVSLCGAQGLHDPNKVYPRPGGELVQEINGSYLYVVSENDHLGQWQVAFGSAERWLELVSVNPQLVNPDIIKPGDTLRIPEGLVYLFKLSKASDMAEESKPDTVIVRETIQPSGEDLISLIPFWVWVIAVIVIVILIVLAVSVSETSDKLREMQLDETSRKESEAARELANPYSGPDQVEGGLPTPNAAIRHFSNRYSDYRNSQTVGESSQLPKRVRITRMKPVDIKGTMEIRYANSEKPVYKELTDWTPAWQAFFIDEEGNETWSISLMQCGNDVSWEGKRMTASKDFQIRDRSEKEILLDHQVWPVIENNDDVEYTESEIDDSQEESKCPVYRELTIKSSTRWLLHKHDGGNPVEINIAPLGDMVKLSYINGEIIAETSDNKKVIGIIGDKPLDEKEVSESIENAMPNRSGETGPTDRRDFNDNSDNDNPAK